MEKVVFDMNPLDDLSKQVTNSLQRMISGTGELVGLNNFWIENAQQSANARDVVDALRDAETLLAAIDNPAMRQQIFDDFAASFWLQKYLRFAINFGSHGREAAVLIVQQQTERWEKALRDGA